MEISQKVSDNLLDALQKGRNHLLRLVDNLTEDMWITTPNGGRWSIQRAACHIINSELFWMHRAGGGKDPEPEYLQRGASLSDFHVKQKESHELFKANLLKESNDKGFYYKATSEIGPSYHWSIIRILQHSIYHTGMISLLRQQVGAPALTGDEETWTPMVDSVFQSVF